MLRAILLLALAAMAPAPVEDASSETRQQLILLQQMDARVATVGWRILTANSDRCPEKAPQSGLVIYDAGQYGDGYRPIAVTLFNLSRGPAIGAVVGGSAADRAGLRAGDILVAINDVPVARSAATGRAEFGGVERVLDTLAAAFRQGPATLSIVRGGEAMTVRYAADRGCPTFVQLVPSKHRGAVGDGRTVSITTAVAQFTRDDDELAVILGHEIAHNILGHRALRARTGIKSGLLSGLGSNGRRLRMLEQEADRVGLELMAKAGYDPQAAIRFWTRFGPKSASLIDDGTHPKWRDRVAAIESEVARLKSVRACRLADSQRCN